jgi:hypothetical protein
MSAVTDLQRFASMSADEAGAHYREYVESNADRADAVARAVGPAADYSEESLVPVWTWVLSQISRDDVVDGLGAYLAEVALRNVPDARWIHWRNAEDDVDYNRPLVALYGDENRAENFLRNALNMVSLARRRERERDPDALLELYRRWTKPPPRPLGV